MNERICGEIDAYAFMVQRGKPAAVIPVKVVHLAEIIEYVAKTHHNINTYYEELSEEWVTLWLYKYPHILEVIKSVPHSPRSKFDHWVLGKLFGYEESAIAEFLEI